MLRGLQAPQQYVILTHRKLHLYNIYVTNQQKHKNSRGKCSIHSLFMGFLLQHTHTHTQKARQSCETLEAQQGKAGLPLLWGQALVRQQILFHY